MLPRDLYSQAHLFVAAVRVHEHVHGRPPSLGDLSGILGVSEEELSLLSRRLEERGIVRVIASGGQERFTTGDHTRIENLPRSAEAPALEDEISRFKARQETRMRDLEAALKGSPDKRSVFSEIEKALKDPTLAKKKNPLD
ncbi:MAG TPA: hypothetical protein PLT69_02000 [Deltaproteobacteria bacterium]|nr:hypothetical protein [Deltaproteobacteria bacterium]HPP79367.1 hypothetical protein [Deltaproteobacteria bacterium]